MYLQTLVILLSIRSTFCDFLPVHDGCKYWSYLKVYGHGDPKNIHCILDQDFQSGLVYTEWKMIPKGTCPIYNRFARQIDSIPCNKDIGMCPNDTFPSYNGVTFTGCYDAIRKQINVMRPPTVSDQGNYPVGLVEIATLSAIINCMFIIVCVWHFICRSKIKLCRDENGMPISNVGKTPDHIATVPAAGMYEVVSIRPKLLVDRELKPDDAKVQKAPCSRRTSGAYRQISTNNSNALKDYPEDTEKGIEQ